MYIIIIRYTDVNKYIVQLKLPEVNELLLTKNEDHLVAALIRMFFDLEQLTKYFQIDKVAVAKSPTL